MNFSIGFSGPAGGESKAKIESYNPNTKTYRVMWEEGGKIKYKDVTSESLRKNDNNKSVEGVRKQREEQERRQREDQERKQREEQERKQKEEKNEPPKNEYTENIKYTENIDVDYSKWNMSKEVKEYLYH